MLRERRALTAAVLLGGAAEVTDFLLPLFAGASLGATPAAIGVLLATELAVSLVGRPLAGRLADRWERRSLAACGAFLYAVACAGYAMAEGLPVAFAAAVLSGAGGALLWVSLRAMVGERLAEDSGVFAKLLSAEEYGGWVVFVPAVLAVGVLGYPGTFLALAACCLAGAGVLMTAPRATGSPSAAREPSALLRQLSPMLGAVVLTMTAEAAVGLLLVLHLQHEFGLPPAQIAMVFLPGAIAMSVLPAYLHRWVTRLGRARMVAVASVSSALFAASLAAAPQPAVIGLAWVLTAAAWAVILPVQQAAVAEVAGPARLGRGLGWYESATLAGGLLGSLAAGFLYRSGWWTAACLVCAAMILAGAIVGPAAIRHLGVVDRPPAPPRPAPPRPAPRRPEPVAALPGPSSAPGPASAPGSAAELCPASAPAPVARPGEASAPAPVSRPGEAPEVAPRSRVRLLAGAGLHVGVFAVALLVAANAVAGFPLTGVLGLGEATINPLRMPGSATDLIAQGFRIWWIVLLVDVVWTAFRLFERRGPGNPRDPAR